MQGAVATHPMFEQLCTEACKGLPERDHENEAWARLGVKQYYFEHFEAEKERHVNESTTAAKQTVEVSDRQDFQKAEKALMAEPENGQVVFGKQLASNIASVQRSVHTLASNAWRLLPKT